MRVAHVIPYFAVGGLENVVVSLVEACKRHDVRSMVVAYRGDGPLRPALTAAGAETALVGGREGLRPLLPVRLARWLRRVHADLVHTHHLGPLFYGGAAARLSGLPLVHTEHSHEAYVTAPWRAIGRQMSRVATLVAVSDEIAAWHESALGNRCRVIPNGVRIPAPASRDDRAQARAAFGARNGEVVVGCVARLAPEKDHVTLVLAFHAALARVPSLRLALIGDGSEREALLALISQRHLGDRVRLLGARPDVSALLPGFDVFALASNREGLPLALLEALAAGVPAVATAVGEVPRVLGQGAGLVVPAGDVHGLSSALTSAARDPEWRRRAGEAGRALVQARFSLEAMAEAYCDIYRSLLPSRGAS